MAQIFVIKDTGAFRATPCFQEYSGCVDGSVCIVLSSEGLDKCVAKGVVEAVSLPAYTEDERMAFIRDYTEFIASLNSRYREKFLWWATDISSKNRYVCPLPDLIQELLEIERGFQTCKGRPLLVVAPSIGIYGALQKMAIKYGRKLLWPRSELKVFLQRIAGSLKNFFRLFLHAVRFYARTFWARLVLQQYARQRLSPQKEFYVIKTFSYPSSWNDKGEYADSFFGRLPRILSKENHVLVLSYHWQGYREFIKRILREKTLAIFPVEFFLKGSDIVRAVWKILNFRLPMTGEVYFRGLDVSDVFRFELARTLNGVQIFQLLHYDAMRNMFKKLHVGTFLFTFENNPWERMSMLACRHHSPLTKLIGYQHSVVPEAALNMFVHPSEKNIVPLPDRILTAGEISKRIMEYYGDYSLISVASACAMRYEYLFQIKSNPRQKSQGNILLVLDGIEQTRQMLKFVLEKLGGHSHYRLKIRCHPALPWSVLSNKFHFDASKYANVEISKDALQEDLVWSDIIIYWQTAVVLEALSMGKPAINFKADDILSYDPLFQSDALKWTVTKQGNLLDIIAAIEDMDEASYRKQRTLALAYIKRYFHPVSPWSLEFFRFDSQKQVH
jgi:hypothetical protein